MHQYCIYPAIKFAQKKVNLIIQPGACIVHLVIKRTNWSYVKTMSCSGSHLHVADIVGEDIPEVGNLYVKLEHNRLMKLFDKTS
jgi:hypothetical protein